MAISTNQKPTIYRNLYENTGPAASFEPVDWAASHVTRMVKCQYDVQIRGIRGGTIDMIKDGICALEKHPTNDTSTVTLVIGSNDRDSPSPTTEIS